MSALTKVFVVLSVIVTLMLSAGLIVYVHHEAVNKKVLADATKANDAMKRQLEEDHATLTNRAVAAEAAISTATQQVAAAQQVQDVLQRQIAEKAAENAGEQKKIAMMGLDNNQLTSAVKASAAQAAGLQTQLADLRKGYDGIVQQNAELNLSNSNLTNTLDATERERKFLAEQVAEFKTQVSQLSAVMKDNGIDPTRVADAGRRAGAPPINGVIKNVSSISGVPYATISVGSSDDVQKGMEFKVVKGSTFLGWLKIDMVDAKEATGRLDGPHVGEIKAGNQVMTQIQG